MKISVLFIFTFFVQSLYGASFEIVAPECQDIRIQGNAIVISNCGTAQPPAPPPPVPPTNPPLPPPPPSGCNGRSLNNHLGRDVYGYQKEVVQNGQVKTYCARLPVDASIVYISVAKQCLGSNITLEVIPRAGSTYADGTPLTSKTSTRTTTYGNSIKTAGYVKRNQEFEVRVVGHEVGSNCSAGNAYDITWQYR